MNGTSASVSSRFQVGRRGLGLVLVGVVGLVGWATGRLAWAHLHGERPGSGGRIEAEDWVQRPREAPILRPLTTASSSDHPLGSSLAKEPQGVRAAARAPAWMPQDVGASIRTGLPGAAIILQFEWSRVKPWHMVQEAEGVHDLRNSHSERVHRVEALVDLLAAREALVGPDPWASTEFGAFGLTGSSPPFTRAGRESVPPASVAASADWYVRRSATPDSTRSTRIADVLRGWQHGRRRIVAALADRVRFLCSTGRYDVGEAGFLLATGKVHVYPTTEFPALGDVVKSMQRLREDCIGSCAEAVDRGIQR